MKTQSLIEKFRELNFHDYGFEKATILPSNYEVPESKIEVVLSNLDDDSSVKITFLGCGNIKFNADFDILKDNAGFGNTSHLGAQNDTTKLKEIISEQQALANIEYEAIKSPVGEKIENLDNYICFSLYFFGGTLEVIAQDFSITKTSRSG